MVVNTTEITEQANRSGRYCGAAGCHDGKSGLRPPEPRDLRQLPQRQAQLRQGKFGELEKFPRSKYGNNINWVAALDKGLIKPVHYLAHQAARGRRLAETDHARGGVGRHPCRDLLPQGPCAMARLQQLPSRHLQHQEENDKAFCHEPDPEAGILRRLPPDGRLPHG